MRHLLGAVVVMVSTASLAETQEVNHSLVRITSHEAHDFHPRWSPDGQSIAFASLRGGEAGIWIMHLTDMVVSGIPTERTGDMYLDWSPDGGILAFDAKEPSTPSELFAFVLEDQRELLTYRCDWYGPDISAIQQYLPLCRIIEAAEQKCQCGLACTGGANQADGTALRGMEGDIVDGFGHP